MKIAIYSRVSSASQTNESQINDLKNWLQAVYPKCEIVAVFQEKESGAKDENERKEFGKVLKLTKADVDYIAVWEISRLYRKTSKALQTIEDFHSKGIGLIVKKENVCTLDENGKVSASGSLILSIFSTIAQNEREMIIERSRRGTEYALQTDGIAHSSRPAFGYKKENKQFVIDDEKAAIVKEIFELAANGYSYNEIADKTGVNKHTIHHIVHNPVYIGIGTNKLVEGKVFPTPRIISDELYYKVQNDLENRRNREYTATDTKRPLWKKVVCPICGSHLTYTSNGKYSCHKCRKVTINAEMLLGAANVAMNAIFEESNVAETINRLETNIAELSNGIEYLQGQMSGVVEEKNEQAKLIEILSMHSNAINITPHVEKLNKINSKISSLKSQINEKELELEKNQNQLKEFKPSDVGDAWLDTNAIRKNVEKIKVHKDENRRNHFICEIDLFGQTIFVAMDCKTKKFGMSETPITFEEIEKLGWKQFVAWQMGETKFKAMH